MTLETLLTIRRNSPTAYRQIPNVVKVSILSSHLSSAEELNVWGYLEPDGSYDGDAGPTH